MATKVTITLFPHTFNGEDFDYWSSLFEVWLKVFDLWKIVDEGFDEPEDETDLADEQKRALRQIERKILTLVTRLILQSRRWCMKKFRRQKMQKEAWQILNKTYKGDDKVKRFDFKVSDQNSKSYR